ncbi:hypothetical protein RCOM_0655480 [Ricinus communis]|uniref:Uncharacterized protein n=1 Tax=Ricinus communis TaxID=3988 RepID=B9S5X0_RICCO|nr:hypothetical protein RCOM_0655480 [Ricinus communis]
MELHIAYCPELESFPKKGLPSSLSSLCICNCTKLKSFPAGGLPSELKLFHIESCNKLICGQMQWGLQMLPLLLHFSIAGYREEDMESFPRKMKLPSTLTSLKIQSLEISSLWTIRGFNTSLLLENWRSATVLSFILCHKSSCHPRLPIS